MSTQMCIPIAKTLDGRRRELGMPYAVLAERSGVSEPTVKRMLGGRIASASFGNVIAVAQTLGLSFRFGSTSAEVLRRDQAQDKAKRLVRMVQATNALESQAVGQRARRRLVNQSTQALLTGSNRRLWSK